MRKVYNPTKAIVDNTIGNVFGATGIAVTSQVAGSLPAGFGAGTPTGAVMGGVTAMQGVGMLARNAKFAEQMARKGRR